MWPFSLFRRKPKPAPVTPATLAKHALADNNIGLHNPGGSPFRRGLDGRLYNRDGTRVRSSIGVNELRGRSAGVPEYDYDMSPNIALAQIAQMEAAGQCAVDSGPTIDSTSSGLTIDSGSSCDTSSSGSYDSSSSSSSDSGSCSFDSGSSSSDSSSY